MGDTYSNTLIRINTRIPNPSWVVDVGLMEGERQIAAIDINSPTMLALEHMQSQNHSSLAVISEDNKLITNISSSDLRCCCPLSHPEIININENLGNHAGARRVFKDRIAVLSAPDNPGGGSDLRSSPPEAHSKPPSRLSWIIQLHGVDPWQNFTAGTLVLLVRTCARMHCVQMHIMFSPGSSLNQQKINQEEVALKR